MPNLVVAEPVIESEVIDNGNIHNIVKILKQDAIDYGNEYQMIKRIMDFYDNTKFYFRKYKNENYCDSNCEEEIDRWINTVQDKYNKDKKGYIKSKTTYEYIIQKLEQLNNEYDIDITEEIENLKEEYDEEDEECTCTCGGDHSD